MIGFDNIVDAGLVEPGLTTIAAPLVSLGSTAVAYLSTRRNLETETREPVLLPARLVLRGSTGPRSGSGQADPAAASTGNLATGGKCSTGPPVRPLTSGSPADIGGRGT